MALVDRLRPHIRAHAVSHRSGVRPLWGWSCPCTARSGPDGYPTRADAEQAIAEHLVAVMSRTIETEEELASLPVSSVVRDAQTLVVERYASGWRNGWDGPLIPDILFPAVVLYEPDMVEPTLTPTGGTT